jgi:hypothetical protein
VKRTQLRRAHVVLVTLVAFAACSKTDSSHVDSAKSLVASSSPTVTRGRAPHTMPGELTKPLDDYTGDEFYTLVQKLSYSGGHERNRKCRKDPGCAGTRRTLVFVDAVATEDSLYAGATPPYGVVYIRAVNRGDAPEARYGLLPRASNYEYYVIVTADSAGAMQWRLEQLDTKARVHTNFASGPFTGCHHKWAPGARADFKTCAMVDQGQDSVVKLGLALQQADDAPLWVGCADGCCIVGP